MKRLFLAATLAAFLLVGTAHAGEYRQKYADLYRTVEAQTGPIEGASILSQNPTRSRLRASIKKLRRIQAARTIPAVHVTASPSSGSGGSSGGGGVPAALETIAQCESGGSYTAQNPSGAYGKYQIMPQTAAGYGCDLSTPAGQDQCAVRIWNGGAGRGNWVC